MTLLVPVDSDSCIPLFCRTVIKTDDFNTLADTPLRLLENYTEDAREMNLSLPKEVLRSILQRFGLPSPYLSTKKENSARSAMVESRSDNSQRLLCILNTDSRQIFI